MTQAAPYRALLVAAILLQATLTCVYAITLHYQLKTSALDLLAFRQPLHNLLNGHGFSSSVNYPFMPKHWFGNHFSPVLYAMVPLYWLFPHVEMFAVVASACVALAAWPVFLLAQALLGSPLRGLCVAVMYLFNPFVLNGALWNFHEVVFAPLAFGWGLWAVHTKNRRLLVGCCVALLCIKEHYGLAVAGFGMLWAWRWQERRFGGMLCATGMVVLLVVLTCVIPYFNQVDQITIRSISSAAVRYRWLTSMEAIEAKFVQISQAGFWYVFKLLLPFLFLPLLGFVWLLPAAADVAANLLSLPPLPRSSLSYHSIAVLPVIAAAFCHACSQLFSQKRGDILLASMTAGVCFATLFIALPYSTLGNVWELEAPQTHYSKTNAAALREINAVIPKDASVSGQINVLTHLQLRERMIPFPALNEDTEFVLLHLESPFATALYIFGIPYNIQPERYIAEVRGMLDDKGWGVVFYSGHWLVLQRGAKTDKQLRAYALERLEVMQESVAQLRDSSSLTQGY